MVRFFYPGYKKCIFLHVETTCSIDQRFLMERLALLIVNVQQFVDMKCHHLCVQINTTNPQRSESFADSIHLFLTPNPAVYNFVHIKLSIKYIYVNQNRNAKHYKIAHLLNNAGKCRTIFHLIHDNSF